MNTYTRPNGDTITPYYDVETDLYADLVAAIHIARAFEAKCERLEAMLENVGDLAHNLQDKDDRWAEACRHYRAERNRLIEENARLRRELDRFELVS